MLASHAFFWWFPFFGGFNGSITREWNQLKTDRDFCLIEFLLQGKSPRWDLFKVTCRTGLGAAVGRGCGLRDLSVIHWLTANWAISGGRHDGAGHWFHSKKSLAISEIWFFGKSTGRRELNTENDKMDGFLSSNNKRNVYLCFFCGWCGSRDTVTCWWNLALDWRPFCFVTLPINEKWWFGWSHVTSIGRWWNALADYLNGAHYVFKVHQGRRYLPNGFSIVTQTVVFVDEGTNWALPSIWVLLTCKVDLHTAGVWTQSLLVE